MLNAQKIPGTITRHFNKSVGANVVPILGPNPKRICFGIFNEDSAVAIRVSGSDVVPSVNAGVYVPPFFAFTQDCISVSGDTLYAGAQGGLQAISTGAAVNVSGFEILVK